MYEIFTNGRWEVEPGNEDAVHRGVVRVRGVGK
jgi:hypothetical protein